MAKDLADRLVVAPGYTARVIYATGDSIDPAVTDYKNDGTDGNFARRSGDHHDAIEYFGLNSSGTSRDATNNQRGLLVMNHENIAGTVQFLHAAGQTNAGSGARPEAEAIKEIEAHGVSVIEVQRTTGKFTINKASSFNRRVTAATPIDLNGPVRGSDLVKTKSSPTGVARRGTVNNCAAGQTPWGTYLTCEENRAGYFRRAATDDAARTAREVTAFRRIGLLQGSAGNNRWTSVVPAEPTSTEFSRWDASVTGADATQDFRNVHNTFGWAVEIDPFSPGSTPRKRTAPGRFAHEGATCSLPAAGKPLAFYMGDDSRGEYVYKFVTSATWNAADATGGLVAGDKYLDAGTLYAAKFNADGTGTWLPLTMTNAAISGASTPYAFADLADVLVNARLAADLSKPDGCWFSKATGILWIETDDNTFTDVTNCMLLAAIPGEHGDGPNITVVNRARGSPDTSVTSDVSVTTRMDRRMSDTLFKRFLTAPKGAEVTGITETPDGRTLFINIQHPGENTGSAANAPGAVAVSAASQAGPFESSWPGNGAGVTAYGPGGAGARPRSSTIMITKDDGGLIGR